jgi:hypothetical protein
MQTPSKPERVAVQLKPIAIGIRDAATHVGLSRGQFYREFLDTGRVRAVRTGIRDRVVIVAELEAALAAYVTEKRETAAA